MTEQHVLLILENVQSARFIRLALEDAGYIVAWSPLLTRELLRSCAVPHALVLDLHLVGPEDELCLQSLRDHPRWQRVVVLATAAMLDRESRKLLLRLGADDVMACPIDTPELLMRLGALLQIGEQANLSRKRITSTIERRTRDHASLADIANLVNSTPQITNIEAVLVQLLRSFRRKVPFDVGFVCAEIEPNRYMVIAHLGDGSFETARWYEPGMSYTGWLALHGKPLLIADIQNELSVTMIGRERGPNRNLQSFIGVPLMNEGHVVGTIEAASYRRGVLGASSLAALQSTGDVASLALRSPEGRTRLAQQVRGRMRAERQKEPSPVVCESPALRLQIRTATMVRESKVPVLITGETGVGKEVMARYLHETSSRSRRRFVPVSCASVPELLQAREMFGVEAGVSGRDGGKPGRFEEAEGGTIFFDEIGHMSLAFQAKLLRVVEGHGFHRVGGGSLQQFAGQIVASTSLDLSAAIASGTFLPALYYRLALIELKVPPLRLRREDIVPLYRHFTERFCLEHDLSVPLLTTRTMERMLAYEWPGNVRELKNAVERSLLMSGGRELSFGDDYGLIPAHHEAIGDALMLLAMRDRWSVPDLQSRYANFVFNHLNRNKTQACRLLRINYRTLCNHLEPAKAS